MFDLINGDCLYEMKNIENNSIDLTVTSPPYDNLRTYENSLDWNENIWKQVLFELFRITKNGGVVVWIVNDATIKGSETGTSFKQALYAMECGFKLETMIWTKPTFTAVGALKTRYAPVFEYMFIFIKGKLKTFNPIKDRKNKRFGDKYHPTIRQVDGSIKKGFGFGTKKIAKYGQRFNVWTMAGEINNKKRCHPAQFPEKLVNDHIISWSNKNDIVFDPFMGSGTTGVMAIRNNRNFIGIEKVKKYFEIAKNRIENYKYIKEQNEYIDDIFE